MKNCIDMPIFHRAICAENVTNKPLSDKRNCIRRFLLRFLEQNTFSEWGYYYADGNEETADSGCKTG